MKLKYPFHVMKMGDTQGAVPVDSGDRRFNGYMRMDETPAFIIRMLQDDVTVEQLVSALKAKYDGSTEKKIREELAKFFAKLDAEGLLVKS